MSFVKCDNNTYYFSSCETCGAKCCDGLQSFTFSQIILEDFEQVYKHFPIVFIYGDLGFLKPVILLNNGFSNCRYLKDSKCTIYEKRPTVCRTYPLSIDITNEIYIDISCPAVSSIKQDETIINKNKINKNFQHNIFEDYQSKYIKLHKYFDKFNDSKNLIKELSIKNKTFYRFKNNLKDKYIELHLLSLKNIDSYFNKN